MVTFAAKAVEGYRSPRRFASYRAAGEFGKSSTPQRRDRRREIKHLPSPLCVRPVSAVQLFLRSPGRFASYRAAGEFGKSFTPQRRDRRREKSIVPFLHSASVPSLRCNSFSAVQDASRVTGPLASSGNPPHHRGGTGAEKFCILPSSLCVRPVSAVQLFLRSPRRFASYGAAGEFGKSSTPHLRRMGVW